MPLIHSFFFVMRLLCKRGSIDNGWFICKDGTRYKLANTSNIKIKDTILLFKYNERYDEYFLVKSFDIKR